MVVHIKHEGLENSPFFHQYYLDIINCMPDIVYWIDIECLLMGCNNNFIKLLNITNIKDMVGTPYDQMIKHLPWPKAYIKSLKINDINVLFSETATYDTEELPVNNKEGVATYYRTTRVPLFDKNKQVIGLVVILTDITALKAIELQLNLINPVKKLKQSIKKLERPIRLLLVDDEHITLTSEKDMFTRLGCKVDIAKSGHAATKLFSPGKYDIVFLDISLGDTSGYVVSKKIREMEENTKYETPIIALTSHEVEIVKDDCEDYFMDAVFTKPLTPEQAMKIVKRFIYHEDE